MAWTCRVVKEYATEYDDPLVVSEGETLSIGGRDTQWAGWVWCWNAANKGGWVPERHLKTQEETGVMLRAYDATELSAQPGETLTAFEEESGWLWCENAQGRRGWIPKERTETL